MKEVRDAFLKVNASLFKDYKKYISEVGGSITQDTVVTIDKKLRRLLCLLLYLPIKECKEQRANMCAINIGISHDNDSMIS